MERTCLSCGIACDVAHRFCAQCGAPLAPTTGHFQQQVDVAARAAVEALLAERVRDRSLVEVELAASVAERLSTWAKVYATVASFLLGLFIAGLALLGYQSYDQVADRIRKVSEDIQPTLEEAKATARTIEEEGKTLRASLERQRASLASLAVISDEVRGLATKVANLEDSVFQPQPGVSRQTVAMLQSSLANFRAYLAGLGYVSSKRVTVAAGDDKYGDNVVYEEHLQRITIGRIFLKDVEAMYHEYTKHALVEIAGRWTVDSDNAILAQLLEGISDYYACSYRSDPKVVLHAAQELKNRGASISVPLRNLQHNRRFPEDLDKAEAHDGGELWGGAFWELRTTLGRTTFDPILIAAWRKMKPSSFEGAASSQFVQALLDADRQLTGGKNTSAITATFTKRGLKV